ncbi:MAG: 16S rRNA (guanine(966)-N(2))-methyltransferase RsmD [Oscillatoria sp. PMC 1051.18]|nr:16S rRNA (guanine(966)-N(2))-methyltransferase RsmD [Oscillatoria sp. PMC 1050.18]MEC5030036.1 16S rRNA (guanine(966)-N(2))-methyltransferase RsmD [Oscillatoria sp. PMC 1051.18]
MSIRIYGNRQLKTLPGQSTRPTAAKVREALFNIWQGAIADCRWLDLCSGNGSMGAEALCRGAKLVVGIEKNPRACAIIRENWQQVATDGQEFKILRGDVVARLKALAGQKFDRIYFDPPYASNLYDPVLAAIAEYQLLDTEGRIAIEHDPQAWTATEIQQLSLCGEKLYGTTALSFYCPV